MTGRAVAVPLARIVKYLPERGKWYAPAWQGIEGLFAIRHAGFADTPPMFQVVRLSKAGGRPEEVSDPFLTIESAERTARRMAEGTS